MIAAFNAATTVGSTVASALSQTEERLEVIVVNDGSTDETAEVVQQVRDPRVRLISQANRGTAAARNAGVERARGKYVAFLDSDDLWLPPYLELARRALETTSNAGFAYTNAYAFEGSSGRVLRQDWLRPPVPPPVDRDEFLLELLDRNFVYNSTTVPRPVLEDVGGFDESSSVEDYELWLRIVLRGYLPARIPGHQALYRMHPGQKSSDDVEVHGSVLEILHRVRLEDLPTPAHSEVLARRLREEQLELDIASGKAGLTGTVRNVRARLGRLRKRPSFSASWYKELPREVAAVFPDLSAV